MAYSLVFFVFMLFVTGGILEVYRRDSRVSTAEFFESSGAFFWRFVRLVIFLLLCMIPVAIFDVILRTIGNHIDERAISAMTIVWFRVAAGIVLLFLLMVLRLCFDMAEVHSVAQNERRMRRSLAVAWRLTFGNFGRLFWLYFSISIVACIGFGFGLWLWMYVLPPTAITGAFFLSQAMILWWLANAAVAAVERNAVVSAQFRARRAPRVIHARNVSGRRAANAAIAIAAAVEHRSSVTASSRNRYRIIQAQIALGRGRRQTND